MSEIQNSGKLTTVGYLAKVLTPIVTAIKSVESAVMKLIGLPAGGTEGQVLVKVSEADGDVQWVDSDTVAVVPEGTVQDIKEDLMVYMDDVISSSMDDGEL